VHPSDDFLRTPELDCEGWRDALRPDWGRYNPEAIDPPPTFAGRVRPRSLSGFAVIDLSCNAHRVARTQHDVRLDGMDYYFAIFQVAGRLTIIQNDRAGQLAVGDAVLVDSARPGTYVSDDRYGQWVSLQLPRRSLVSHLGFEPQGGILRRGGTAAGRMLFDLVRDADTGDESTFSPAESYMRLAIYDLLGALFAPSDPVPVSLHTDKLLSRSAASSGIILPIRLSVLTRWRPKREARYATFRSSFRLGTRPAVISYIRFVWITPRAFYTAGNC
jgi:AraC family transcriptional activator of tynA and feaB